MASRIIPNELLRVQIQASDPAASAWVAANAGSGKTHVLAQRVIRLLLEGVEPAKILCITFTKAAAANMANRVFDELRRWTALDDARLDAAIAAISELEPDSARRARARRLFAVALETPGGLKVQTIHAFCARLLHQFPFEAKVAARFDVLDESAEAKLLEEVRLGVLLDATGAPDSRLGHALAAAIAIAAERTFKEVVGEAIHKRDVVRAWIDHCGSIGGVIDVLCATLGIAADDTVEQAERDILEGPLLPVGEWAAAAELCKASSSRDQEQCARLTAALAATGSERLENYLKIFFDHEQRPRVSLVTQALAKRCPELAQLLCREQARLIPLRERRNALACRDRTAALITFAGAVITSYTTEKNRRGLLDYDDLIDKTLALLQEDCSTWVHYKLDQGIDHVLIDEAQDTSPKQWEIIRQLSAEFFAGAGARQVRRTIFAVGDEKQSIFSFQGAAPREFEVMHRAFEKLCTAAEHRFRYLRFRHSFRSDINVLGAVDKVFERPKAFAGLSADAIKTLHAPLPDAASGMVEIWDTIKPEERREIEAWDAPFDHVTETSPQVRLAAKIARNVKKRTEQGARAGDVLILVRQRGPLFEAIIRELKDLKIPVAGADRLILTEHIAVMDLMVLADALLLPEDDLALATVLKSPLFGLDDSDLFEIAWQRNGSLRAALRAKSQMAPRFAEAAAKLDRFADWARRKLPFAFYAEVLGAERGRKRFLSRLGHEADDAINEFLNLALDYERRETPSLHGFLAWLRAAQSEVKRDMEITRDEVRVMTVHGAKGLEAPIVILADTTTPPAGPRQPRLIDLQDSGAAHSPPMFVWATAKANDTEVVSMARERIRGDAENEYRRLLYVAMTRAINRLIVCGADGERRRPDGCWWNLVFTALQPVSEELVDEDGGKVWRYCKEGEFIGTGPANISSDSIVHEPPPVWLDRQAPCDPPAALRLSPSRTYDESGIARTSSVLTPRLARVEQQKARARGVLTHRLLQALPDIPPEGRAEAAQRHLERTAHDFTREERELVLDQVRLVLEDARFSALFSAPSRAEVPIVGRVVRGGLTFAVSGQIDRLAVTGDEVLIADYKTNRPAPARIDDVPRPYMRQLALYGAILAQLYPDKIIRAALLWTDVPALMEVPPAVLQGELAVVTSE
jgi:ATP-dependent helicase/nuclease subunit A